MQGIMKKIVMYYFWTKLTFIILLIVMVVLEDMQSADTIEGRARIHFFRIAQTQLVYLNYAL